MGLFKRNKEEEFEDDEEQQFIYQVRKRKGGKTQFNVLIDYEIKQEVQRTAKICRMPIACFTEHCLEVGTHYINQTLKDEEKRKILDKHLELKHLLNENIENEDSAIRLTENNSNWLLLDAVGFALARVQIISKQIKTAIANGNREAMRKYESQLYDEMMRFFKWVQRLAENERY